MQSKYEGNKEQIQKKPKSIDKRLAKGPVIICTQGWGRRENGWVAEKVLT